MDTMMTNMMTYDSTTLLYINKRIHKCCVIEYQKNLALNFNFSHFTVKENIFRDIITYV